MSYVLRGCRLAVGHLTFNQAGLVPSGVRIASPAFNKRNISHGFENHVLERVSSVVSCVRCVPTGAAMFGELTVLTFIYFMLGSTSGLGHYPLKVETQVRILYRVLNYTGSLVQLVRTLGS